MTCIKTRQSAGKTWEKQLPKIKEYLDKKMTLSEISRRIKFSRKTILRWINKVGLEYKSAWTFDVPENISDIQKQVLNGTILGDDCLYMFKTCTNPKLLCYHSISAKPYAQLKLDIWKDFVYNKNLKKAKREKGTRVCFQTTAHKDFLLLHKNLYKDKKKIVPFPHLKTLTNISLAFWFQDDGSRCKNRGLAIHTNSFTIDEVEMICEWFKEKHEIYCNPQKRKENQYVVFFSNRTTDKFTDMILPFMHPSMRYKLKGVFPKNPQRLHAIPFRYDILTGK